MGVPKVVYRNQGESMKNAWIRYILGRIYQKNKNWLGSVIGPTGSGKTYFAIAAAQEISKQNNVHFSTENIVFDLKSLMSLVNSAKLKKGSCIIFDEPQVSISNREFQSKANRVFNYLLTTFRHRNFILFFCTPYEDLLDKTSRKLFHAKFTMTRIDKHTKISYVKPMEIQYNSSKQKFYNKYLRVYFKPKNKDRYIFQKVKSWGLELASKDILHAYEAKKLAFTKDLNIQIEMELDADNKRKQKEAGRAVLTDKQDEAFRLLIKYEWNVKKVKDIIGISSDSMYQRIKAIRKKGYPVKTAQYSR